jgi:hypothetical protein
MLVALFCGMTINPNSLRQRCLRLGLCYDTIRHRMRRYGMTFEQVTAPDFQVPPSAAMPVAWRELQRYPRLHVQ